MIVSFRDRATEDIYHARSTKAARKALPPELHEKGGEVLDRLAGAVSLRSLSLPGMRLEKLKGARMGQHSIRINRQYRVCFRWTDLGAEDVEIVDYH